MAQTAWTKAVGFATKDGLTWIEKTEMDRFFRDLRTAKKMKAESKGIKRRRSGDYSKRLEETTEKMSDPVQE